MTEFVVPPGCAHVLRGGREDTGNGHTLIRLLGIGLNEGSDPSNVRGGHRGSIPRGVAVARQSGQDVGAGGSDVHTRVLRTEARPPIIDRGGTHGHDTVVGGRIRK